MFLRLLLLSGLYLIFSFIFLFYKKFRTFTLYFLVLCRRLHQNFHNSLTSFYHLPFYNFALFLSLFTFVIFVSLLFLVLLCFHFYFLFFMVTEFFMLSSIIIASSFLFFDSCSVYLHLLDHTFSFICHLFHLITKIYVVFVSLMSSASSSLS